MIGGSHVGATGDRSAGIQISYLLDEVQRPVPVVVAGQRVGRLEGNDE